jgi:hypothetical protein
MTTARSISFGSSIFLWGSGIQQYDLVVIQVLEHIFAGGEYRGIV